MQEFIYWASMGSLERRKHKLQALVDAPAPSGIGHGCYCDEGQQAIWCERAGKLFVFNFHPARRCNVHYALGDGSSNSRRRQAADDDDGGAVIIGSAADPDGRSSSGSGATAI